MSNLQKLRSEVILNIKSILLANKDGCTEKELIKQYYQNIHDSIPYQCLGFNSLKDFLNELKDYIIITKKYNNLNVYQAKVDESNERLKRLVDGSNERGAEEIREANRKREVELVEVKKQVNVPSEIQNHIKQLLSKYNEPISNNMFNEIFYELFGYQIDLFEFESQLKLFQSLDHLVNVKVLENNDFMVSLIVATPNTSIDQGLENLKIQCEDDMLNLLYDIVEKHDSIGGIELYDLHFEYTEITKQKINFRKYGFSNLYKFMLSKFGSRLKITEKDSTRGTYLVSLNKVKLSDRVNNRNEDDVFDDAIEGDEEKSDSIEQLIDKIHCAFLDSANKYIPVDEFVRQYRDRIREDINHKKYGFNSLGQLLTELAHRKIVLLKTRPRIEIKVLYDFILDDKKSFQRPSKENINKMNTIIEKSENNSTKTNESFFIQKQQDLSKKSKDDWIKENCIYDDIFDDKEIFKSIDLTKPFDVSVANCPNPHVMYLNLWPEYLKLEQLMTNLENVYYEIGSCKFDMPDEYMIEGKICAAIFPYDNNWHRCRIVKTYSDEQRSNLIRVSFMDYGGEADVLKKNVKFLKKSLATLPIQAIKARFAYVAPKDGKKWQEDITNYLLNLFNDTNDNNKLKLLKCRVSGMIDDALCVTLWEQKLADNIQSCLNTNKLIEDGYAEFFDDENCENFVPIKWY